MESIKLKLLVKITNGFAFKSERYTNEEGARIIRITNVQKGKIVDNDPKKYSFSDLTNFESYKIFENDILMSLTGNVGRVGRFPSNLLPAYINQRVCRVKSISDKLSNDYLFHYLNSDIFEKEAIQNSAGAAQLNLSTNWLLNHEIPLPDLTTQRKIAALLDKADELRQYNKQLIEKYDTLTQSLFIEMFGDLFINSNGNSLYKLQDLVDKQKIITYGIVQAGPEVKDGVPYIKSSDIKNGKILVNQLCKTSKEIAKSYERSKCSTGDIIMSIRATVGTVAILPQEINGANLTQGTARISPNRELINPIFLYYALKTKGMQLKIEKQTKGATFKEITLGSLRSIELPVPKLTLQNQFVGHIQLIEQQKELAQQALQKSEELFNSLLQKAFKGELVPEYEF